MNTFWIIVISAILGMLIAGYTLMWIIGNAADKFLDKFWRLF